ncbi:DNA-binding response regulator [Paenibacillus sp. CAA11]|uniref:response regulator transcription factor n=1 Tax=Paenibacillus sp. CAA11 TaxID=1532905 RepID=UPI000D3CC0AB|nr:response regulator [Paenibacillus sp. CAA11]AWB44445.1 DNA-binding response regulator [Paenibacillus sp. CAA11]
MTSKVPYRVLIADDEPIIREGIRDAMDWSRLGMEVIHEAEDGEEALELAVQSKIDVLLVDMNMPFLDGIGLMKRLRIELPDCRFVIITGHDEFAYAQEAIRLGVEDYILKPVNADHLWQVLFHVKEELDNLQRQHEYLEKASEQLTRNIPLLRDRFCKDWVEGQLSPDEIREQLEFLKLPVTCPQQLGVIRWPEMTATQTLTTEGDRQLFLFAIENIAEELLQPNQHVMFRDRQDMICFVLWEAAPEETVVEIERNVQQYMKVTVQAHLQRIQQGLSSLVDVYRSCREHVCRESQLSPLARRARQVLQEYYNNPDLTLEGLAAALQVSPVHLSRVLKKELGASFVNFLTQMRIRKAIQLLNATNATIHEIAEQVGYESQHYFSTAFKKVVGVSPNQYRKGAAFQAEE